MTAARSHPPLLSVEPSPYSNPSHNAKKGIDLGISAKADNLANETLSGFDR